MTKIGLILIFGILVLAAFLRFWQLDSLPPGLYPDVAVNGNNALDALENGQFKIFYPDNNGREGLFINLIALSFWLFGPSVWAIKIVAALFGTLTVLGTYLFTVELFNKNPGLYFQKTPQVPLQNTKNQKSKGFLSFINNWILNISKIESVNEIALLASFFIAVSFWHILLSRIGFRAIMTPFILVFSLYFLLKGLRRQKFIDFILAGIFFGLGFHTYISFRLAIFIPAVIFLSFWSDFKKTKKLKKYLILWLFFLGFVFLVALPMIIYFINHPEDFISRAAGISIFAQSNPLKSLSESFIKHLAMFNIKGDSNWRHNYANSPMLFWPLGILFLTGLFICLRKTLLALIKIRQGWKSNTNPFLILIVWFFAMLLPGILTIEGIPHALRVVGVIPAVMIITAAGSVVVFNFLKKLNPNKWLLLIFTVVFLNAVVVNDSYKYFVVWGKNPKVPSAFTENFKKMGEYLNSLPAETQKYVIVNEPGVPVPLPDGIPMPAQTLMFMERLKDPKPLTQYLLPEQINHLTIEKGVILIMKEEADIFIKLWEKFPRGKLKRNNDFWLFVIE